MKPDTEKTVGEWYEEFDESYDELKDIIRRIQRAAFEKGAKAQREADVEWLKKMRDEWMSTSRARPIG